MSALQKRVVFLIKMQNDSPLAISSGEMEFTDSDLMRNYDEKVFIPGSSLAGAFRAYLEKNSDENCLMGYSKDDSEGKMSSLYLSDFTFDSDVVISLRDSVALDDNKISITGSKFDMEVIEAKATGYFYMEYVIRSEKEEVEMETELSYILQAINKGEIRFGSNKTRGFGKFLITSVKSVVFDKNNYEEYAGAYELKYWDKINEVKDYWLNKNNHEQKMIHIEIPLRMRGGISIRQYAVKKGEPDFVQLTDHGKPVIPGTSLAGAIRHRMKEILNTLDYNNKLQVHVEYILNKMFGMVKGNDAYISNVIIGETEINNTKTLTMVRNGISRFESATKDGALYKERTCVDGDLNIKILVRKQKNESFNDWFVGLLLLAIKDLQNGYLAVGGQTAIGRGIFEANGKLLIDGEADKEDEWISKAFNSLAKMGVH